MTDLQIAAARYAENGFRVIPLHSPTADGCSCEKPDCSKVAKHPRISDWSRLASNDPAIVSGWWATWPDANIGLQLDGVAVLDIDPRNGGNSELMALESEHGRLDQRSMQFTGSGGFHYLFSPNGAAVARGFRPGLDLLTGGSCYIVVSPSVHASGTPYAWLEGPDPLSVPRESCELLTAPLWLLNAALGKSKNRERKKSFHMPDVIGEGERNTTLTSLAGAMRRTGMSHDAILAALQQTNREKCSPPMSESDVEVIAKSVARYPASGGTEDGGLTRELADTITATASFARDPGGMLYVFDAGCYRPTGKRHIERKCLELCDAWGKSKTWSPELASRVEARVAGYAPELWERPPLELLCCRNGLLDVGTKELRPHSPEYLSPVQIAASFDPSARCPNIDRFVADVFPSDANHLAFELAAWVMLPDTNIQKALLAIGQGSNGKSVFLSLLQAFIGPSNVSALSLHKIESDKFAASRLLGKLANICPDLPTVTLSGTSMFKSLTGGDTINAERKFESSFEFRPYARLVFSANSAPRSDDATHGFFRRWLVVPFNRTFDEKDAVPRAVLDATLSGPGELSGLLNKALAALPVIRAGRFTESASTREALQEFISTTDPLAVYLDSNTLEKPGAVLPKERLRSAYGQVCQEAGRPVLGEVQFTSALRRLRPKVQVAQRRVDGRPTRVFIGLGFVTGDPVPDGGLF
jgi:P4 family phage/plasmid primase-like protien